MGSAGTFLDGLADLEAVGGEDGANQVAKPFLQVAATAEVAQLDALAFAADESRLSQDLEVLAEGGLGKFVILEGEESRAGGSVLGTRNLRVNLGPDRVREGVENTSVEMSSFEGWYSGLMGN